MASHDNAEERPMPRTIGLTHVAMSVPEGTLTDEYRAQLLDFYGRMLGWREMESLRLHDRLTVAVGSVSYINTREQPDSMVSHGYEHFGVLVGSSEEYRGLWTELANEHVDVQLEPLSTNEDGEGSFRFRYLLPMAVEVQYYARLSASASSR
jgi:hypothetical protein